MVDQPVDGTAAVAQGGYLASLVLNNNRLTGTLPDEFVGLKVRHCVRQMCVAGGQLMPAILWLCKWAAGTVIANTQAGSSWCTLRTRLRSPSLPHPSLHHLRPVLPAHTFNVSICLPAGLAGAGLEWESAVRLTATELGGTAPPALPVPQQQQVSAPVNLKMLVSPLCIDCQLCQELVSLTCLTSSAYLRLCQPLGQLLLPAADRQLASAAAMLCTVHHAVGMKPLTQSG